MVTVKTVPPFPAWGVRGAFSFYGNVSPFLYSLFSQRRSRLYEKPVLASSRLDQL